MKKEKIIYWISTGMIFAFEGLMPLATVLFAPQYVTFGTKALGYPDYFAYALIGCKIIGVTVLMLPKFNAAIKEWAYAGLFFNLLFAVISHAAVDQNIGFIAMPIVVAGILAVSYRYNKKLNQSS